jgi:predicted nuclease of restriction endonuclease-like (RecB) superfamily
MDKISKNIEPDFEQVLRLIHDSRNRVYAKANAELVILYFTVGGIVSQKVAKGLWGEGTVDGLAQYIQAKLPNLSGFNRRGLYRMKQFYETYNEASDTYLTWHNSKVSALPTQIAESRTEKVSELRTQLPSDKIGPGIIVSTPVTQLQSVDIEVNTFVTTVLSQIQWSAHLHLLNKTKTAEGKLFYLYLSVAERMSVREIERALNTATFERTMLSNTMAANIKQNLPDNLFKDPYIFEFLDLPVDYSEKDLEKALIKNLQHFILEIGKSFTYMGNQFRLQVGNKDYYTDLLFYHRDLQCLVLFELKIEEFQPEHLGKINFYLEALDRDVKRPHEYPSIGVLLCKGKDTEVVEYASSRYTSTAMVADYETKLIDKTLLANKLHQLVELFEKGHETEM